jgi:DNA helicase HerA-like ATPase
MSRKEDFTRLINDGYLSKGESIILGGAILDGEALPDAHIKVPLKTLNRHGLIAGATGTGKTKTIQVLSEQLSSFGIPVLMMDIKGDFSGIAKEGEEKSFITERHSKINIPYKTASFPVELLSLSEQSGVRLRPATSSPPGLRREHLTNNDDALTAILRSSHTDTK